MRRVTIFGALCVVMLLTAKSAVAESLTLNLTQAVELALSDNPTIKIADQEVVRYDYVRKTTMGSLMPQLSVDGTYNRTLQNQSMAEGFSLGADQYNTITATANLSLALYSPAIYRTLRMNAKEAESAVESARSSRIELVAAVKSSFYQVLLAERSLVVLEQSAETSKQTVDETQVKFDNGLSSEYDLLTAQVQYSNLQPSIMEARTSIEIAKDLLKMYLSIPLETKIELTGDLDKLREAVLSNSTELSRNISGNSSIKSLALSREVLVAQLRINNASRLPVLSAYGQLSYTGNNMGSFSLDGSSSSTSAANSYFWQRPSSVGLALSVPIFAGLSNVNRSRQLENQIEQIVLQQSYLEDSVNVSLSTAINNINTAREQLFAQITTVGQATKAYEISNTRYTAGAGTILELNTSRLTLTQAELNLSEAIYNLLIAKCEYDRLVGSQSVE